MVLFNRTLETILTACPNTHTSRLQSIPIWLDGKIHAAGELRKHLGTDKDILFCQHDMSHAASAFLVSPFDEAAIITADGVGEWTTPGWGVGRSADISFTNEIRFPHSVGLLFIAITAYLGFRVNDAE